MNYESKTEIFARYALSPRCKVRDSKVSLRNRNQNNVYSWKNYLKTGLQPEFLSAITPRTSHQEKRMLGVNSRLDHTNQYGRRFSKNPTLRSNVVDVHINNISKPEDLGFEKLSPFRQSETDAVESTKQIGSQKLSTMISISSSPSLGYSRKSYRKQRNTNKQTERSNQTDTIQRNQRSQKEWVDDYHLQLREQERKYLLAKFMEHVEKVHKVKL